MKLAQSTARKNHACSLNNETLQKASEEELEQRIQTYKLEQLQEEISSKERKISDLKANRGNIETKAAKLDL